MIEPLFRQDRLRCALAGEDTLRGRFLSTMTMMATCSWQVLLPPSHHLIHVIADDVELTVKRQTLLALSGRHSTMISKY